MGVIVTCSGKPERLLCKSLGYDNRAVMELPHKLMITAIIMAVVLPVVLESVEVFDKARSERELEAQCAYLADTASALYRQGEGSSINIELKLPDKTVLLSAGAAPGGGSRPDSITIRYKVAGGQLQKMPVKSGHLYIYMSSDLNTSFLINSGGEYSLNLKKCESRIDLNGDGFAPDNYIQIGFA
jgi:hypothetical protein